MIPSSIIKGHKNLPLTSYILLLQYTYLYNSPKMFEADDIETSADSPLLDVGTEDEIESRGDDIEDIESSTRMMVQETTNSEFKIYKKGKNLEKPYHQIFGTFFLF